MLWGDRAFYVQQHGVACHEAFGAESSLVLRIDFDECACDSQTESFCLTFVTAAVKIDFDVVFFCYIKLVKGLLNDVLQYG